jgi:hypothetical protein
MNGKDIADELRQIVDLHAAGALTDDEFAAAKAAVLGLSQRRRDPLAREHDTATSSVTARVPQRARSGNRRKVLPRWRSS